MIQTYKTVPGAEVLFPREQESVGPCPRCGKTVVERPKGFFCEDRGCGFAMWKNSKFFSAKKKKFTRAVAADLLNTGQVRLNGCLSERTGKIYDATVLLEDDGKHANFVLEFDKGGGRS